MRKRLPAVLLGVCVLLAACGSRETGAETSAGGTAEVLQESSTAEMQEESWEENGNTYMDFAVSGLIDGISSTVVSSQSAAPEPALSGESVPAVADYDDVEMGDNMLQATVDGEKMTFYLAKENTASDGYELSYISFTSEGEANYRIYLRIPLRATAGSYSNSKGKACYFSVSTRYNEEKGTWGDSYRMVHYGSSSSKDIGTYSLTLDADLGFEYSEGSGSFAAELEGFSSATEGKSMSITDGVFRYMKGEAHEIVQAWQDGSLSQDAGAWIDPYQGIDKTEKKLCTKCGGTGKVICSICDGEGTLVRRKNSVDLGSGSTGYTETVKCACKNGYYDCSRCGGSGYLD